MSAIAVAGASWPMLNSGWWKYARVHGCGLFVRSSCSHWYCGVPGAVCPNAELASRLMKCHEPELKL